MQLCLSSNSLSQPISTLLVDDRPDFRQGLRSLLDFYNSTGPLRFQIVGQAASVEQGLQLAAEQSPALILLDLELGQSTGLDFLKQWRSLRQSGHVLVLSGHQEDEWIFKSMQAGAHGYVFKHQLSMQLLEAISTVVQGQIYCSPEVATQFFRVFHFYAGRSLTDQPSVHLTEREREVLYWIVQGASNDTISRELNITVGTVKAYLTAIFDKLEVTSRTQAAMQALKLGLVSA